jgi:hypothetical protein
LGFGKRVCFGFGRFSCLVVVSSFHGDEMNATQSFFFFFFSEKEHVPFFFSFFFSFLVSDG